MNDSGIRFIHTNNSSREIADLLQTIFATELLMPSQRIWLVSPWISDIPILDNRANQFLTVEPQWARRFVSLSEVLAHLIKMGTKVNVITRPADHNHAFLQTLQQRVGQGEPNLFVRKKAILHAKGLLGDRYYLMGSMNFTFNGITVSEESLQYLTDPVHVAENRAEFVSKWGGEGV